MKGKEEKTKHAYACKTIFGILTEFGIDTEYEKWLEKKNEPCKRFDKN